ncbi:protein phosphatase CheZ, partial [Laribacter hongkongensis]
LGYDKSLERAASAIPDAKDRLSYIATLTENAAERALNATDRAQPHVTALEQQAGELAGQWQRAVNNQLSVDEFRTLALQSRDYFTRVPAQTQKVSAELMEIVMAQDFQDLTGQVIKKVVDMVQIMEHELLTFLMEYQPEVRIEAEPGVLENGPVVNPTGRTDVVTNQQQVDDLLASLGF